MPIPLKNRTIEKLGGSETVGFNTHTHIHTHTHTHTQQDQIQNIKSILSQRTVTKTHFRTDFTYKMGAIQYTSLNYNYLVRPFDVSNRSVSFRY